MKVTYKALIQIAEQYTKKGKLPSIAKKVGTHATGVYAIINDKPRLLREKDWLTQDQFGHVAVHSDADFKAMFVEVK